MAKKNYLIEGVSGTGKSSVCVELRRRGYYVVDGDKELAYQGNPKSGEKTTGFSHENHIWDIQKVKQIINNTERNTVFFCGGSRNFHKFIHFFDGVFVLDVDKATLNKRLDARHDNAWGKELKQRELILRLHSTKEDIPSDAMIIDATQQLERVVDQILAHTKP